MLCFARVRSDRVHAPFYLDMFVKLCWPNLSWVGGSPRATPNRREALNAVSALIAFGENEGVYRCSVLELSYQPPET